MNKQYYVYIMTNRHNAVLYTGVTSKLKERVYQHKEKLAEGFTKRYNICRLVYFEVVDDPETAITREKKIKAGSRQRKIDLVNSMNPGWADLYDKI
jgi:putative endonuclease